MSAYYRMLHTENVLLVYTVGYSSGHILVCIDQRKTNFVSRAVG